MGFINRLYNFATHPAVDPDVGVKIDNELNQILSLLNGAIDNLNIGGNPDIDASKLSLGGSGFLPGGGGQLTGLLEHLFSGVWRRMGASGGVLIREYRDTGVNVAYGIVYNTYYTGSGWAGRDVADVCMRLEMTTDGKLRYYWAPSSGGGVAPVWYSAQHMIPMGGTSELGDVTITGNQTQSGIYHYKNLTINNGVVWTLDQGKPVIIFARESVTINGIIDGNAKGAAGGIQGSATPPVSGIAGGAGGYGGSNGTPTTNNGGNSYYAGFKANGGTDAAKNGGAAPTSKLIDVPSPSDGSIIGGAGGGYSDINDGGAGGGFIMIVAPVITIGSTGILRCNATNGQNGGTYGGGGGGGGVIWIRAKQYTLTSGGALTVTAGTGGTGSNEAGGNGGAGLVFIEELK